MNNLPELEAKEIFDKFLEYFTWEQVTQAKVSALICARLIKQKCSTTTEKVYWSSVINHLSSF